jgi:hypothetical protein
MAYEMSREKSRFRWGFQVSPQLHGIHGVKLLLDDNQESRYGPYLHSKGLIKSLGKDPVDVASDYLGGLFNVLTSALARRLGDNYVSNARIRAVLTVPAVWSDKAKDVTLQAAERAGLSDHELVLVSEPEAAALYTLRAIQPNTITVCTSMPYFAFADLEER